MSSRNTASIPIVIVSQTSRHSIITLPSTGISLLRGESAAGLFSGRTSQTSRSRHSSSTGNHQYIPLPREEHPSLHLVPSIPNAPLVPLIPNAPPVPSNPHANPRALAISHDTEWVASCSQDFYITLSKTNDHRTQIRWSAGAICALALSPDDRFLVAAHGNVGLVVWPIHESMRTGNAPFVHKPKTLKAPEVGAVAWSPDGSRIAAAHRGGAMVYIWSTNHKKEFDFFPPHDSLSKSPAAIVFVTFSPDGRLLAYGGERGHCHIWNVKKRKLQTELCRHNSYGTVSNAQFDAKSQFIVTCSNDSIGSARVWDAQTGKPLLSVERDKPGPPVVVRDASFSPDGKLLLVAGEDGWLYLLGRISEHSDQHKSQGMINLGRPIRGARFSPDGQHRLVIISSRV
ncbi:hypothetical protein VTO73DRAFT_11608 [Trametes versicolor]